MTSVIPVSNNFRQSLISKVVSKVDESAKLEEILSGERDIELFQLKQFVWKYSLPEKQRFDVWSLLLGVRSGHPEIRATIDKHRNDEAESLWRSLCTMRLNDGRDDPVPSDIVRMILLSRGDLKKGVDFRTPEVAPIVTIVHHMRITCATTCGFDGWREAFSLSRAAHRLFLELFPPHVIDHIYSEVVRQVEMEPALMLSPVNLKMHMQSGGAALFKSTKALQKLWDKVLSGGESPPFLMTQLLISYLNQFSSRSLKSPSVPNVIRRELGYQSASASQSSLKDWTFKLSEEDEMRLVNQSTDAVLRKPNFKMSEPSSSSSSNSLNNPNTTSIASIIRGETARRSDGWDRPPPSPIRLQPEPDTDGSGYVIPAKARDGKELVDETPRKRASTMSEAKLRSLPIM